jgi:hypothetical protein
MAVPNHLPDPLYARFKVLGRQVTALRASAEGLRFFPYTVKRVISRATAFYEKLLLLPVSFLEVLARLLVRSHFGTAIAKRTDGSL